MVAHKLLLLIAIVANKFVPNIAGYRECQCMYDIPADWEPDCRDYGQIETSSLIGWHRANESCLEHLGLNKNRIMPFDTLWRMCPFRNETGANTDAFLNYIQNNEGPVVEEIKTTVASNTPYFNNVGTHLKLADHFTTEDGRFFNCSLSERLCWGEVKVYFVQNIKKVGKSCASLWDQQVGKLVQEQKDSRKRLCEGRALVSECDKLSEQIMEVKAASCDQHAQGASSIAPPSLPACGASSPSSAATRWKAISMVTTLMTWTVGAFMMGGASFINISE